MFCGRCGYGVIGTDGFCSCNRPAPPTRNEYKEREEAVTDFLSRYKVAHSITTAAPGPPDGNRITLHIHSGELYRLLARARNGLFPAHPIDCPCPICKG